MLSPMTTKRFNRALLASAPGAMASASRAEPRTNATRNLRTMPGQQDPGQAATYAGWRGSPLRGGAPYSAGGRTYKLLTDGLFTSATFWPWARYRFSRL